ncbi:MAG: 50S ribosomal protein L33 [Spirochaetota bacterium]
MAKKSKDARQIITLESTEKGPRGVSRYTTTKNRKNTPGKLELKKYCKYAKKHVLFKEIK